MLYLNRMHNYNYTDTYYYYVYKQHIITDNCHFSIPNSMEIWTKLISLLHLQWRTATLGSDTTQKMPDQSYRIPIPSLGVDVRKGELLLRHSLWRFPNRACSSGIFYIPYQKGCALLISHGEKGKEYVYH